MTSKRNQVKQKGCRWHIVIPFVVIIAYNAYPFLFSSLSRAECEEIILKRGRHQLDRFCTTGGDCFNIYDTPFRNKDKRLVVERYIVPDKIPSAALSQNNIIIPEDLNKYSLDTSKWDVQLDMVVSFYCQVTIAAGFMIEALQLNGGRNRILAYGLGGGQFQNYIGTVKTVHLDTLTLEIEPEMAEISAKYFGRIDTPNNRVIVADGIEYSKKLYEQGEFFDYLFLDACSNDQERVVVCPIDGFRTDQTIEVMSKIVGPQGGIFVNILVYGDVDSNEEELRAAFAVHFKSCFLLRIFKYQRMLVCSHRENWTWETQKERFLSNLKAQEQATGLIVAEQLAALNPPHV